MAIRVICGLAYALCHLLLVAGGLSTVASGAEYRTIDASGNNLADPEWGQVGAQLLRWSDPDYADGMAMPRDGAPAAMPSARAVSNMMSAQLASMPNSAGVTDWFWQWGQFLSHDIELTAAMQPAEAFDIPVPMGDPYFDPTSSGTQTIGLGRSAYDVDTGTSPANPRQQINQITAYIDASNVYGSDATRAAALRSFSQGKLLTSTASNGETLLPLNLPGLPNDGGPGANLFLAGDPRANEQTGLTAAHTLFVREHNRLADDIGARIDGGDAVIQSKYSASGLDRDEFIYQTARKVVGAQMQIITYQEFLPHLLGDHSLAPYAGYDPTVNVGISNEFSSGAFRFGHTMLSSQLQRRHMDGSDAGALNLLEAFFNPQLAKDDGIDSLLLGLSTQRAQEVDTLLIDDVRNFLFGPPGAGGFDLAALNIQRGRDHGLPSLNDIRIEMGLSPHVSFLDLAGGDADQAAALSAVYDTVDAVDLWIGGLSEAHVAGGLLGETFSGIVEDQFARLRDGDRFFYLDADELSHLSAFDPALLETRLSDVIMRNTAVGSMRGDVFRVPEPTTLVLAIGLLTVVVATTRRRSQ